jgi:UrcA family protein
VFFDFDEILTQALRKSAAGPYAAILNKLITARNDPALKQFKDFIMKLTTIIFATLSLTAIAMPAYAEDAPSVSKPILIRDLDLTSATGMQTLKLRIKQAAQDVCGGAGNQPSMQEWVRFNDCVREARSNAMIAAKAKAKSMTPATLAAR